MCNARLAGDLLEKAVCDYLLKLGLNCRSLERLNRLNSKDGELKDINVDVLRGILPIDADYFSIASDNDGRNGIVGDIIIGNANGDIVSVSCKKNNVSIKHQRPVTLWKHLNMQDRRRIEEYKRKYNKIVGRFYKYCREKRFKKFADIKGGAKVKMFREVNELVAETLLSSSKKEVIEFMKYLLSLKEPNLYILHYSESKNIVSLYKTWFDFRDDGEDLRIRVLSNTMMELTFQGVKLLLRVHNASSRILPTISLKYDTKLCDKKKYLFEARDNIKLIEESFVA